MIEISNLEKSFGQQKVLKDINLNIKAGETIAIVGPSGTGKSVLLKIISGLLKADKGEVKINNRSITSNITDQERREVCADMGILFQNAALFDSLNLYDNVAFPLIYGPQKSGSLSKDEIHERVISRIKDVGMGGKEFVLPNEVSIGMRKRIGIARALVKNPEIILFDEPNTGLDPYMGQEIYDLISQMQKKRGFTGIVISHEIPEVFQVCSRVTMLYQGFVKKDGSVEDFMDSKDGVVQQFVSGSVEGPIKIQ